jgi:fatty acid desaturase
MTTMAKQQDDERRRRQKVKNWVLFAVLFTFVAVVYFVALIRMSGG